MKKTLKIGDRVALTASAVKYTELPKNQYSASRLRGEIIAIVAHGYLAVVQWEGVPDHEANHTYAIANLCKPRSVAFSEVPYAGKVPYHRNLA